MTTLSSSSPNSLKAQGSALNSKVIFETNSFSTVGFPYIQFKFNHIAKLYFTNSGRIEYSTNGTTWNALPSSSYIGSQQYAPSTLYVSNEYFNAAAYTTSIFGFDLWEASANAPATSSMWVNEVFDLRGIANDPITFQGYSNFRLRFVVEFIFTTPFPMLSFYDGWYVDDLEVIGSTCSLTPSAINFNIGPSPSAPNKPLGNIPLRTSGNYTVSLTATNPSNTIAGVDLLYDLNGTSFSTAMTLIPGSTDQYTYTFINLAVGDTVNWKVQVNLTGCSSSTINPLNGNYQFQITEPLPPKCGNISINQPPYIINTFPWVEDFEGSPWAEGTGFPSSSNLHRGTFPLTPNGNYLVTPNTSSANASTYAWSVGRNTIPGTLGQTGPSANHTVGGANYLFTAGNFNSPAAGSTVSSTRIITPCIDLDANKNYGFEFWYHAFGQNIGSLSIDIDTGSTNSSFTANYYTIIGEQQTNSADPWKRVFIPLIPFSGKTIKIRLNSRKFTTGPNAFMAIDDLSIYEYFPEKKDLLVDELIQPLTLGCSFTSAESVEFSFTNNGTDTLTILPFAYQLNNNPIIRDTLFHPGFLPFSIDTFLFAQTNDLSFTQVYDLKIWSEVPNDTVSSNDTISYLIASSAGISQFPFLENFELASPAASFNGTGTGSLNNSIFQLNSAQNGQFGPKWKIFNDAVRKKNDGPVGGAFREGNYLLFQNEGVGTNALKAVFESSCIDFTSLTNPQLSFLYHNMSAQTDLRIEAREINSSVWQLMSTLSTIQTSKKDPYVLSVVDLNQFAGKTIILRIIAEKSSPNPTNLAIDNIRLYDRKTNDYGLVSVDDPGYRLIVDGKVLNTSYTLANEGLGSTIRAMVFKMSLTEVCAINNPITFLGQTSLFTDVFPYGQMKTINKTMTFSDTLTSGLFRMKAWIEVAGDPSAHNDTIERNILLVNGEVVPYFNDFEDCAPQFFGGGEILDWERTDATKAGWTGSISGQNSWVSHANEDGINTIEVLTLPPFIGFDSVYGAEIRFWQNYNLGLGGYGFLEYRNGGVWQNLTPINGPTGINWNTPFNSNLGQRVFTGSSGGWIYSSYPLTQFTASSNSLSFRFMSSYENAPGWAIDDFEIFVPEQNSASPEQISFQSQSIPVNGNNSIQIKVKNTGFAPLDEFELRVDVNGVIQSQQFNLASPINQGQTVKVNFSNPIVLSNGTNTIEIISYRPNNRKDDLLLDDTLKIEFSVLPIITSLPYCNDFEQASSFLNFDTKISSPDTNWIYGSPNKPVINSSYSGTYSWYTSNDNYYPQQDQFLFTNEFFVNKNQCYELSFWHQFYTEFNFDGGMLEYTIDLGNTWLTLGSLNDSNWYNTPHIQSLDAVHPGWSGLSNGWEKVTNTVQFFDSTKVQFRFRFATSSILHFEGWAIDDFCFEPLAGSCSFIGQEEEFDDKSSLSLFPNPIENELNIIVQGNLHGNARLKIVNSLGKVIYSSIRGIQPKERFSIPTDQYSKGIYILVIEFDSGENVSKVFEKM